MAHLPITKMAASDWTAAELAATLSEDNIRALVSNFGSLEQGARARVILATALVSQRSRLDLQSELKVQSKAALRSEIKHGKRHICILAQFRLSQ